jgi:hypothetical protein
MNEIIMILFMFDTTFIACHADEEINYSSITDNGRFVVENRGTITFEEGGIKDFGYKGLGYKGRRSGRHYDA